MTSTETSPFLSPLQSDFILIVKLVNKDCTKFLPSFKLSTILNQDPHCADYLIASVFSMVNFL